ncbi:MAG: hypothetical protein MCSN_5380 [Candidatus Microsyncoccus archaeolyticus]|nr:MAG: hypothetical protein MCSN_5380 [Candidatus Parcubacteria bacterium]
MEKSFPIEILEAIEQVVSDYNLERYDTSSSLGKKLEQSKNPCEKIALKILFDNEIEKTFNLKKTLLPSSIIKKLLLEEGSSNIKLALEEKLNLQSELAQEVSEKLLNNEQIKNFFNKKPDGKEKSFSGRGLNQELI